MSIYVEDNNKHVVRCYYTSPKIEESIERLLKADEELMYSETLPGYKVDFVEEESCKDVEMRDATPKERESIDKYINSISTTTGVNIMKLEQEPILDKIRMEIIDTGAYEQEVHGKTEFLEGINYCLSIIDKYKAKMLPGNTSNGSMIQDIFPNQKVSVFADGHGHKMISVKFTETEWNAPYNGVEE